ncbi:MAG: methylated-DNA--[protein]-cysteine S-methyltransferase, partial [Deltaproteobacteria bacterium]|nr:methylated-DNA--[protein]-cysteine S-methyltransferase [Deltaproteobacteria bacterium]
SPIGTLYLASSDQGLVCISLSGKENLMKDLERLVPDMELEEDAGKNKRVIKQLKGYFSGAREDFDLSLHLIGTEFQKLVWRQLCQVPFGQTASYKEIAEKIGKPQAMRAVGQANHRNPIPIIIPCHRIIGANGHLVGFGGGLDKKRFLLSHEGVL